MLREKGIPALSLKGGYTGWLFQQMQKESGKEDSEEEENDAMEQRRKDIELSIRKKFHKQLFSRFARGINDYELVKPGDKIAVCISGGKDSMLMAKLFQELKRHNKFPFELVFLVMDPGYNEANRAVIEHNARLLGIPITVFETEIFDAVYNIEKSPCYLCARMRRGYLYSKATFARRSSNVSFNSGRQILQDAYFSEVLYRYHFSLLSSILSLLRSISPS